MNLFVNQSLLKNDQENTRELTTFVQSLSDDSDDAGTQEGEGHDSETIKRTTGSEEQFKPVRLTEVLRRFKSDKVNSHATGKEHSESVFEADGL